VPSPKVPKTPFYGVPPYAVAGTTHFLRVPRSWGSGSNGTKSSIGEARADAVVGLSRLRCGRVAPFGRDHVAEPLFDILAVVGLGYDGAFGEVVW